MTTRCRVCVNVPEMDLIALDAIMGDPLAWPKTVWGTFEPPKAPGLPASYRRYGAVEMGLLWLAEHGYPNLQRRDVRIHYKWDVPKIGASTDDLVANGLIRGGRGADRLPETLNPQAFLTYFAAGIEVGVEGLKLLRKRITDLQKNDQEVPLALIKMAIDAGSKLAMSQATIVAAGKSFGGDGDIDEGFRAGSAPLPSPRMGDHRVRIVEGESRPIRDRGPQDRAAYSDRAEQEGGVGLPHP